MRLWSLHPKYLDARGLVALWREALLAQAEWVHLNRKLKIRAPAWLAELPAMAVPQPHPAFTVIRCGIARWEITTASYPSDVTKPGQARRGAAPRRDIRHPRAAATGGHGIPSGL